jgi:hypothetical protein
MGGWGVGFMIFDLGMMIWEIGIGYLRQPIINNH